jgi:uncharacterized membrane protein
VVVDWCFGVSAFLFLLLLLAGISLLSIGWLLYLLVPTTHHKNFKEHWRLDGLILIGLIIYFNFKEQTL